MKTWDSFEATGLSRLKIHLNDVQKIPQKHNTAESWKANNWSKTLYALLGLSTITCFYNLPLSSQRFRGLGG